MITFDDFIMLINDMTALFETMTGTEKYKLNAALNNDILEIENCMKLQQADVLKFRGLDKKRIDMQAALGYSGLSLKEILPLLDEDKRQEYTLLFDKLDTSVKIYQSTFDAAKKALELNLHSINKTLAASNNKPVGNNVYSQAGQQNKPPSAGHFTSRQV